MRTVDDSYIHVENLRWFVEQKDWKKEMVFGEKYCHYQAISYPTGGPGILMSRAVIDNWDGYVCYILRVVRSELT